MGIERRHVVLAIVFGLACGLAILAIPRALAALTFWLGYDSLKPLFFDRLGFSKAMSDLLAGAIAFFLPTATYVLFVNLLAVWTGHADPARLAKTFAAYALLYLLPPAVTALVDATASTPCFDQRSGQPRLFYSVEPGGAILLSDSAGYDRFGVQRKPVSEEVCRIADRQKRGLRPRRVTTDACQLEFFDPAGGGARIYFSQSVDGGVDLFDGPGVDPTTNEILRPATTDIAKSLCLDSTERRRRRSEEDKQRSDREAALRLIEAAAATSSTGFECALDGDGVSLHELPRRDASPRYPFTRVAAYATYAAVGRGPQGEPGRTLYVVEVRAADDAPSHQIRCLIAVANPAAIDVSALQRQRSDELLAALERLGARIVVRVPDIRARREALLPKGAPPQPDAYGCLREGRAVWCHGQNACGEAAIPVVTDRCEFDPSGRRTCRVACAR